MAAIGDYLQESCRYSAPSGLDRFRLVVRASFV